MTHERLSMRTQRCSIQTMLVYIHSDAVKLPFIPSVRYREYNGSRILGSGYMSNDDTEYNSTLSNERGGGE